MSSFPCWVIYEFQQLHLGSSTSPPHHPVSPHIPAGIQALLTSVSQKCWCSSDCSGGCAPSLQSVLKSKCCLFTAQFLSINLIKKPSFYKAADPLAFLLFGMLKIPNAARFSPGQREASWPGEELFPNKVHVLCPWNTSHLNMLLGISLYFC